jgi:hypothetical protein
MHDNFTCRICLAYDPSDDLVSPCLCKGSMCYVHNDCLARWIHSKSKYAFIGTKNGYSKCEVCGHAMVYNVQSESVSSLSNRFFISSLTLFILMFGIVIIGVMGCFSSYLLSQDQKFREGIVYLRDVLGKYDKNLDGGPMCHDSWSHYAVIPVYNNWNNTPLRIVHETSTQSFIMNITTPKSTTEYEEMVLLMNEMNTIVEFAMLNTRNRDREFKGLKEKGGRFWRDRTFFWRNNYSIYLDTFSFGFCFYAGIYLTMIARHRTSQLLFALGFLLHVVLFTIRASSRRVQLKQSIVYNDINSFLFNLSGDDIHELTQGWTTLTLVFTSKIPLLRGMYKAAEKYAYDAVTAANWKQSLRRLLFLEEEDSRPPAKIIFEHVQENDSLVC